MDFRLRFPPPYYLYLLLCTFKRLKMTTKEAEWQQEAFHRVSGKLSERMIEALKYLLNGA